MECKDRLDFALAATSTGLWSLRHDTQEFDCEGWLKSLWGIAPEATVTFPSFLAALHEEDAARISAYVNDVQGGWPSHDVEVRIRRLDDGADRWIAMRGKRVQVDGGHEIIGTARDITESKLHDSQVHLLMREVTHRSKNLLAIIQAMARRTVKHSLTASDFEERFSARLRGLAFSHEILASQDWRGASLRGTRDGPPQPDSRESCRPHQHQWAGRVHSSRGCAEPRAGAERTQHEHRQVRCPGA